MLEKYYKGTKKILTHLKNQPYYYIQSVTDPKTQVAYEYRAAGDRIYELCAAFETDSSQTMIRFKTEIPYSEQSWDHAIGRACFEREVQEMTKALMPL